MFLLLLLAQLTHAEEPASQPAEVVTDLTPEQRLQQFKEQVVLFEDWVGVSATTGQVMSTWTVPKKGIYGEPLNGAQFYDYIGQPELAKSYRKRNGTMLALRMGGLALGAGGLALSLRSLPTECQFVGTATYPAANSAAEAKSMCRQENEAKKPMQALAVVLGGIGVTSVVVSATFGPHPVRDHERKKLAAQFNDTLARDLGIDPNAK